MKFVSDRLIVVLALSATSAFGAFILAIIVPSLFFHTTVPPQYVLYVRVVLFFAAGVGIFAIGPLIFYQFRRNLRLQNAINHYVRNKMQEIVLAVDLVQSNLVQADTDQLTYKEKVQMLDDVRAICEDVSGNLAEKIIEEASDFDPNIASRAKNPSENPEH
jgi:ABC-type multidrug transport system fused ATPase/permease subunit